MLKEKDWLVLSHLRKHARETLTGLSKRTKMPISTLYDRLKWYRQGLIEKFTIIVDFPSLGFLTQAYITIKVKPEEKKELYNFLMKNGHVNSLFRINNGYDYLLHVVFRHVRELEDFMEVMERTYKIKSKNVWYVIDSLKQEDFLNDTMQLQFMAKTSAK